MKDFLQLIRWGNLLFIAILLWIMEKWVVVPIMDQIQFGEQLPWYLLTMIIVATICIAAGGYVINDYFDVKIDRINRPDKLIVTNTISKESAMRISIVFNVAGIALGMASAWLLHSWTVAIIYFMVPGLLWFYSSSYKRLFLIGNVIIAFNAALTPMVIAFANVGLLRYRYKEILSYLTLEHDIYAWIGGFALFAFLCTLIREIVKSMQDQMGDRELECHSLPIVLGDTWTKVIVTILTIITIALIGYLWYTVLPFPHIWNTLSTRYIALGIIIPLVGEIALIWAAKIPSDYRNAQLLMKYVMAIGTLYAFVIMRNLGA